MKEGVKVEITEIVNGIPGGFGSGETIYFTYGGTKVRLENWSVDNGSGSDFYDVETGQPWSLESGEEEEDQLREILGEALEAYYEAWTALVNPAIEEAAAKGVVAGNLLLEQR